MTPLRQEIQRLSVLAAPVVITQLATMMLGVVDTIMIGHVSRQALAAAALGHVWTMGTMVFGMGVIIGIDPIVTQAHGARDANRMSLAFQRGIIVAGLVSIPLALLWAWSEPFLLLLRQPPELCAQTQVYTRAQIPGAPFFMLFTALRQYLQGRGIVRPTMVVALVANAFNVVANWSLIYGHLGLPALELQGAGFATASTRIFMVAAMAVLVSRRHLMHEGWAGWSRRAWRPRGLREVLHFGAPVGVQLALEIWAFEIATLLAGWIGEIALASHAIVLQIASISFMVPLGISQAAVTRVGNLLGAGLGAQARRAAWVAMAMGSSVMALWAIIFVALRHRLGHIYTDDPAVVALAASILPIAAAFQLFDGTQVVGAGVLRGMGSTRPAAIFNLIGFYGLAFPLAWWLGFRQGMGLAGIWWGLALGLAVLALFYVLWILRRGPGEGTRPVTSRGD